jgi:hypothetical protein
MQWTSNRTVGSRFEQFQDSDIGLFFFVEVFGGIWSRKGDGFPKV